jgi:hypothetical protein
MGDTIEIQYLFTLMRTLAARLPVGQRKTSEHQPMRGDAGSMTTETVIIIAGLAALALAVVAIIVAKVTDKANSIPTS